jgi:hypothetical protein
MKPDDELVEIMIAMILDDLQIAQGHPVALPVRQRSWSLVVPDPATEPWSMRSRPPRKRWPRPPRRARQPLMRPGAAPRRPRTVQPRLP